MHRRVATPELYSTHTRATAHAIANSISHFGGFLGSSSPEVCTLRYTLSHGAPLPFPAVPYLIDGATVPAAGAVLALMNFAGLASVQFLPETLGDRRAAYCFDADNDRALPALC